jgi:hypothetical protein
MSKETVRKAAAVVGLLWILNAVLQLYLDYGRSSSAIIILHTVVLVCGVVYLSVALFNLRRQPHA